MALTEHMYSAAIIIPLLRQQISTIYNNISLKRCQYQSDQYLLDALSVSSRCPVASNICSPPPPAPRPPHLPASRRSPLPIVSSFYFPIFPPPAISLSSPYHRLCAPPPRRSLFSPISHDICSCRVICLRRVVLLFADRASSRRSRYSVCPPYRLTICRAVCLSYCMRFVSLCAICDPFRVLAAPIRHTCSRRNSHGISPIRQIPESSYLYLVPCVVASIRMLLGESTSIIM